METFDKLILSKGIDFRVSIKQRRLFADKFVIDSPREKGPSNSYPS